MSSEKSSDNVLLQVDQRGVARLTLNRPDRHNAFDDQVIADIQTVLDGLAQRGDIRVLVLAGEGRSFSAGADLNWMQRMVELDYQNNLADARRLAAMLETLNTMPMPVIARVSGAAYGGGVGLVACSDIAIADSRASFSLSEVKLGLVPATISPYVVRAMGERAARRYFLSGEPISAATALRLGLISELVEADALDSAVEAVIENLLRNGPSAVAAAKQLIADVAYRPVDAALMEHTSALVAGIRVSEEGQEGLQAFLGKRRPAWYRD